MDEGTVLTTRIETNIQNTLEEKRRRKKRGNVIKLSGLETSKELWKTKGGVVGLECV